MEADETQELLDCVALIIKIKEQGNFLMFKKGFNNKVFNLTIKFVSRYRDLKIFDSQVIDACLAHLIQKMSTIEKFKNSGIPMNPIIESTFISLFICEILKCFVAILKLKKVDNNSGKRTINVNTNQPKSKSKYKINDINKLFKKIQETIEEPIEPPLKKRGFLNHFSTSDTNNTRVKKMETDENVKNDDVDMSRPDNNTDNNDNFFISKIGPQSF